MRNRANVETINNFLMFWVILNSDSKCLIYKKMSLFFWVFGDLFGYLFINLSRFNCFYLFVTAIVTIKIYDLNNYAFILGLDL